jgi:hypothetical protein
VRMLHNKERKEVWRNSSIEVNNEVHTFIVED